jgi:hypothetical protein
MHKSKAKGRGRGGKDLTLISGANRHVRLPLSKWRGYGVEFFSGLMAETVLIIFMVDPKNYLI